MNLRLRSACPQQRWSPSLRLYTSSLTLCRRASAHCSAASPSRARIITGKRGLLIPPPPRAHASQPHLTPKEAEPRGRGVTRAWERMTVLPTQHYSSRVTPLPRGSASFAPPISPHAVRPPLTLRHADRWHWGLCWSLVLSQTSREGERHVVPDIQLSRRRPRCLAIRHRQTASPAHLRCLRCLQARSV